MANPLCTLGDQVTIRGTISGNEDLTVAGHVDGKIVLGGHLVLENSSVVEAEIDVEDLTVRGTLRSQAIRASRAVALDATADVSGDIHATQLVIDEGAQFTGRIEMPFDLPASFGR